LEIYRRFDMTIIHLVRHGANDFLKSGHLAGRQEGVHLNNTGLEQVALLVDYLKKLPIKAIYSSPLERTMQTAIPIADALKLEVSQRYGLNEIDLGDWQNKKISQLRELKIWQIVQYQPSRMRFPSGESFYEAQYRIVQEIDQLIFGSDQDDMIVFVTHADLIKLAVAFYIGMSIDTFQRLEISPASITSLEIKDTNCRLKALNYQVSPSLLGD